MKVTHRVGFRLLKGSFLTNKVKETVKVLDLERIQAIFVDKSLI